MVVVMIASAALLCIAAQTGFLDGPRVMANMATDSWLPHRFSALSERLTMHYGILIIGAAAMATLFLTGGDTVRLVTMYSINVFITFSLSNLGMCRFWIRERARRPEWGRRILIHALALVLCSSILVLQVSEKFLIGGWETVLITGALIALCVVIRRYYRGVQRRLSQITPENSMKPGPIHPSEGTYNWDTPDRLVKFGEENNIKIVGHNLAWHSQNAPWMFNDNPTKEKVIQRLRDHIHAVVGRYKGKIMGWDVVNEAIADNPMNGPQNDGTTEWWRETWFIFLLRNFSADWGSE